MNNTIGLREQIKHAQSEKEVSELLLKSKSYEWASEFTKRAWKSTAKSRLAELSNPVPTQVAPSNTTQPKKTAKKLKKK